MGLKKRLTEEMHRYVERSMLPACWAVAHEHGYALSLEDFSKEVLEKMKGGDDQ